MTARPVLVSVAALIAVTLHLAAQQPAPSPRATSSERGEAQPAARAATENTSGDLTRGRYLVEHVAMCIECHSTRDAGGRIIAGREYMGGNIPFAPPWPNDWASVAPRNAGLVGYSDEQAMRLLTAGAIGREGVRLRPPMPRFQMTPEDAAAVIAYLRSR
jgi:mono/diheme cytochrome c family protein